MWNERINKHVAFVAGIACACFSFCVITVPLSCNMAVRSLFGSNQATDDLRGNAPAPQPYYCSFEQPRAKLSLPPENGLFYMDLSDPNKSNTKVKLTDLYDWSQYPSEGAGVESVAVPPGRTPPKRDPAANGLLCSANDQKIAVFRFGDKAYATDYKCPHLGGPLHMGEIEMLPDNSLCIRCPWHGWKFALDSGKCVRSNDSSKQHSVKAYPIKIDYETGELSAGFGTISPRYFNDPSF